MATLVASNSLIVGRMGKILYSGNLSALSEFDTYRGTIASAGTFLATEKRFIISNSVAGAEGIHQIIIAVSG